MSNIESPRKNDLGVNIDMSSYPAIPRELAERVKAVWGWEYPIAEDQPESDEDVLDLSDDGFIIEEPENFIDDEQ
jgi:hypothetical protein